MCLGKIKSSHPVFIQSMTLASSLRCSADLRKELAGLTFEGLITTEAGMSVSRALINVLIDQQMTGQMEVGHGLRITER